MDGDLGFLPAGHLAADGLPHADPGLEIGLDCEIGYGLFLPHTQGTVIGAQKIGDNATIYQKVTIGAREVDTGFTTERRPSIGNNVVIGSGAKIIGPITSGDHVVIAPNSLVMDSIESNSKVIGVPAKVFSKNDKCV